MTRTNPALSAPSTVSRGLRGAEALLFTLFALLLLGSLCLHHLAGRRVEWTAFVSAFSLAMAFFLAGLLLRATSRRLQRHADGSVAMGLFIAFAGLNAIFAIQMFPLSRAPIDPHFIALDRVLGYDWVAFVTAFAAYPTAARALGWVYDSFLIQLVLLLGTLAVLGRRRQLHSFLLVSQITLCLTLAFWWLVPSIGTAAHLDVPLWVEQATQLRSGAEVGTLLAELAADGTPVVKPGLLIGTIAYPSYHMVMACMVIWFSRGTLLFGPALAVNTAMVPATLMHGGHHLVDLVGGIALFAAVTAATARSYGWFDRRKAGRSGTPLPAISATAGS